MIVVFSRCYLSVMLVLLLPATPFCPNHVYTQYRGMQCIWKPKQQSKLYINIFLSCLMNKYNDLQWKDNQWNLKVIFSLQLIVEILKGEKSCITKCKQRPKKAWKKQKICWILRKIAFYFNSWSWKQIFPIVAAPLVKMLVSMITRWNKMGSYAKFNKYPIYI